MQQVLEVEKHPICTTDKHRYEKWCGDCVWCIDNREWENRDCYDPDYVVLPTCPIVDGDINTKKWIPAFLEWVNIGKEENETNIYLQRKRILLRKIMSHLGESK